MEDVTIVISEDEALVLYEFVWRFDETGKLTFVHPAEYVAFQRISAQIESTPEAPFRLDYWELLEQARARVAEGFEGEVPGMEMDET